MIKSFYLSPAKLKALSICIGYNGAVAYCPHVLDQNHQHFNADAKPIALSSENMAAYHYVCQFPHEPVINTGKSPSP